MSNNIQSVELTDITAPLLAATKGLTTEDHECIISLLDCAKRGETHGKQSRPSICEVPRILREHNESSFIPQLVSIGPIHREDPKLKEFQLLKECYLDDLLSRCEHSPKETLEACLLKVNTLIPQIRESYAGVKKNYSNVDLARMMVMDGCFILEFCFKHEEENLYRPNKMQNLRMAMDLMLLENQVPFSVLRALFDCSMGKVPFTLSQVLDAYLAPYIKLFHSLSPGKNSILSNVLDKYLDYIQLFYSTTDVDSDLPKKFSTTDVDTDSTHDHVLGYLHRRYQLAVDKSSKPSNPIYADVEASKPADAEALLGHTIVELDRSGMNFKPHQEGDWSMTIKFQSSLFACLPGFWKPTLLMPTLVIDDTTELILRNFIAYEQSFPQDRNYFTSYVQAMDTLIDTPEDVAKLVKSKVLLNKLVSNQEAADMINKIGEHMFFMDFCYTEEFKQMDKYCNRFWPKNKRIYFSNPWNAWNLVGGIIVFLATVVAAIFAVLDYFR